MSRWALWGGLLLALPFGLLSTLFLLAPTDVFIPLYTWSAFGISVVSWWIVRTCAYRLFDRRRR